MCEESQFSSPPLCDPSDEEECDRSERLPCKNVDFTETVKHYEIKIASLSLKYAEDDPPPKLTSFDYGQNYFYVRYLLESQIISSFIHFRSDFFLQFEKCKIMSFAGTPNGVKKLMNKRIKIIPPLVVFQNYFENHQKHDFFKNLKLLGNIRFGSQ